MPLVLPGLDVPALRAFLTASQPGLLHGDLHVELISGGRSNLTYALSDGRGRWVLRRPPLGHVLATAHDMAREHRVLAALHPTDVPVPRPVALADSSVIGVPFYVMEHADGTVLREHAQLRDLAGAPALRLADELITVLARLHALDPAAVGLADLGRPLGYLDRQLARWQRQLDSSHCRDQTAIASLGARLASRLPAVQRGTIVHGDYRLDNVVVGAGPTVVAVLDWEMATLGDPLADLASTLVWWDGLRGLDSPVAAVPGDVAGFPPGRHLLDAYALRTGWDLAELPWYLGFAYYKIAAIFEGIYYRARQGFTVGDGFEGLGDLVPGMVERGQAALAEF